MVAGTVGVGVTGALLQPGPCPNPTGYTVLLLSHFTGEKTEDQATL